ncbi:MAG: flagellar export chaperone FliS [Magnetococcales bacterium]|nr:flagellar export chaperone FliS [Magnetococcales bacterium]
MSYALRSYKTSRTSTASREDLLILLYEGAIRFLERSITEKEAGRLGPHKEFLRRGIAIISELQNTLDFQKGGDLSIQLFDLYGFMLTQLTQANISQDVEFIRKVNVQMETLLEGWREAVRQVKASGGLAAHAASTGTILPEDNPENEAAAGVAVNAAAAAYSGAGGFGSVAPPRRAAQMPKPAMPARPATPTLSRSL